MYEGTYSACALQLANEAMVLLLESRDILLQVLDATTQQEDFGFHFGQ
jgi:hypothetical protein